MQRASPCLTKSGSSTNVACCVPRPCPSGMSPSSPNSHSRLVISVFSPYLEARAYEAIAHLEDLRKKQTRFEKRKGRKDRKLVNPTTAASSAAEQAIALADDVGTLLQ